MKNESTLMDVKSFLKQLQKLGNAERAGAHQRYHKSKREHWGVTLPECDQFVRTFSKTLTEQELLLLANKLWETDLFDPMMCAGKILTLRRIKPSRELWKMIISFLKHVDGWALEDLLAHVAWKCLLSNEENLDEVEAWTKHSNFWMRRAALVYTLPYAKPGRNPERMLDWASGYVNDPEWFIQKAIGWWLRVLGEHNPERVCLFLKSHWMSLKGVARKEATRKLDKKYQALFEKT